MPRPRSDMDAGRRATKGRPYGATCVHTVGDGALDVPLSDIGAGRRAIRESPLRGTGNADCRAVGRHAHMPPKSLNGGAIRGSLPTGMGTAP